VGFRGTRLHVEIQSGLARYRLGDDASLAISHHGEPMTVIDEAAVVMPIPTAPERESLVDTSGLNAAWGTGS